MTKEAAYLVGIHRYSFQAGKPAEILGVHFYTPDLDEPRPCYLVLYADDRIDMVPLDDSANYKIISESDVLAGRIPEVTE